MAKFTISNNAVDAFIEATSNIEAADGNKRKQNGVINKNKLSFYANLICEIYNVRGIGGAQYPKTVLAEVNKALIGAGVDSAPQRKRYRENARNILPQLRDKMGGEFPSQMTPQLVLDTFAASDGKKPWIDSENAIVKANSIEPELSKGEKIARALIGDFKMERVADPDNEGEVIKVKSTTQWKDGLSKEELKKFTDALRALAKQKAVLEGAATEAQQAASDSMQEASAVNAVLDELLGDAA